MTTLKKGDKAPEFTATNQDGNQISLSNFKGKSVVLYFYPKDDTPGCTKEACSLRDGYEKLKGLGLEVVGVSPDSVASHQKFIAKYNLPFTLISDTERQIATTYGVFGEKKMYGKPVMGLHRTTFIINGNGEIAEVISKVDTAEHVDQILKLLQNK
jgi:peroxiredoxin Q/BCP